MFLFSVPGVLHFRETYVNTQFPTFLDVLKEFINDPRCGSKNIEVACFGVAGPTNRNKATLTNAVEWTIDGHSLAAETGIKVVQVINDFVAAGYGVITLCDDNDCVCIQRATKVRNAPICVVGAGTGLGECFLTPSGNEVYTCFPTEGGHVEFAARTPLEREVLAHFTELHPARVSVERLVSGSGVVTLYDFFAAKHPELKDAPLHARVSGGS